MYILYTFVVCLYNVRDPQNCLTSRRIIIFFFLFKTCITSNDYIESEVR